MSDNWEHLQGHSWVPAHLQVKEIKSKPDKWFKEQQKEESRLLKVGELPSDQTRDVLRRNMMLAAEQAETFANARHKALKEGDLKRAHEYLRKFYNAQQISQEMKARWNAFNAGLSTIEPKSQG